MERHLQQEVVCRMQDSARSGAAQVSLEVMKQQFAVGCARDDLAPTCFGDLKEGLSAYFVESHQRVSYKLCSENVVGVNGWYFFLNRKCAHVPRDELAIVRT